MRCLAHPTTTSFLVFSSLKLLLRGHPWQTDFLLAPPNTSLLKNPIVCSHFPAHGSRERENLTCFQPLSAQPLPHPSPSKEELLSHLFGLGWLTGVWWSEWLCSCSHTLFCGPPLCCWGSEKAKCSLVAPSRCASASQSSLSFLDQMTGQKMLRA